MHFKLSRSAICVLQTQRNQCECQCADGVLVCVHNIFTMRWFWILRRSHDDRSITRSEELLMTKKSRKRGGKSEAGRVLKIYIINMRCGEFKWNWKHTKRCCANQIEKCNEEYLHSTNKKRTHSTHPTKNKYCSLVITDKTIRRKNRIGRNRILLRK